jgi:hypothetical protein
MHPSPKLVERRQAHRDPITTTPLTRVVLSASASADSDVHTARAGAHRAFSDPNQVHVEVNRLQKSVRSIFFAESGPPSGARAHGGRSGDAR